MLTSVKQRKKEETDRKVKVKQWKCPDVDVGETKERREDWSSGKPKIGNWKLGQFIVFAPFALGSKQLDLQSSPITRLKQLLIIMTIMTINTITDNCDNSWQSKQFLTIMTIKIITNNCESFSRWMQQCGLNLRCKDRCKSYTNDPLSKRLLTVFNTIGQNLQIVENGKYD